MPYFCKVISPYAGEAAEGAHLARARGGRIQAPPLELHSVPCMCPDTHLLRGPSCGEDSEIFPPQPTGWGGLRAKISTSGHRWEHPLFPEPRALPTSPGMEGGWKDPCFARQCISNHTHFASPGGFGQKPNRLKPEPLCLLHPQSGFT